MSDDVTHYIASFPKEVADRLRTIQQCIQRLAPNAEESMSYGMPAYKTHGKPLVYFAGYAKHIGLYATPSGHEAFADQLASYKQGKGSVQFPLDRPLPMPLIEEMIAFRVEENAQRYSKSNS